jgi:hypothetical protein
MQLWLCRVSFSGEHFILCSLISLAQHTTVFSHIFFADIFIFYFLLFTSVFMLSGGFVNHFSINKDQQILLHVSPMNAFFQTAND